MVIFGTLVVATAVDQLGAVLGDAVRLVFPPDHEAGDVLQEDQRRIFRCQQSSTKCAPFSADSENSTPLLAMMPTGMPWRCGEAADERRAVARLELVEARAVDDAGDHLAHVIGRAQVGRARRRRGRPDRRAAAPARQLPLDVACARLRLATASARQRQRMRIVARQMIGDAGKPRVHIAAAEVLGR